MQSYTETSGGFVAAGVSHAGGQPSDHAPVTMASYPNSLLCRTTDGRISTTMWGARNIRVILAVPPGAALDVEQRRGAGFHQS